jgi:hypothetical protein
LLVPCFACLAFAADGDTNLFGRVYEFCEQNKTDIFTIGFGALVFIAEIIISRKNASKTNIIDLGVKSLKSDSSTTLNSQEAVVKATNELIDSNAMLMQAYKEMKERYDQVTASDEERNRNVIEVALLCETILEILSTVYNNSKVPQAIKDIVNLKYAKCFKALDDNSVLLSMIEPKKVDTEGTDE